MSHRGHAISSESPQTQSRDRKTNPGSPPSSNGLAPCPGAKPTPMETVCHGPLPLAGRLSFACPFGVMQYGACLVTSSAQPEGHPAQDDGHCFARLRYIIASGHGGGALESVEFHNQIACCVQLSLTSRLQSCRISGCCGEIAWEQSQATQPSNNTIGASLTKKRQRYQMEITTPSHLLRSLIKSRCVMVLLLNGWAVGHRRSHSHINIKAGLSLKLIFWRLRLAGIAMITCGRVVPTPYIATESAGIASLGKSSGP